MHIPIDIVILAVIAVALLARLFTLFGTKREDEPQRPNPFIPPPPQPGDANFAAPRALPRPELPPASLAGGLAQVKAADKDFDEKQFLAEAREIFTQVVETYATGDLGGIADKLSPALLAHFQSAADARRAQGETAQSRVAEITEAEPVAARAEGTKIFITVKFVSAQENILRDGNGRIIGGAAGKTEEATDVWVFSRDAGQPGGKWVVAETRG